MSEKLELEVKPEVLTKEVEKELMANKKIEEKLAKRIVNCIYMEVPHSDNINMFET